MSDIFLLFSPSRISLSLSLSLSLSSCLSLAELARPVNHRWGRSSRDFTFGFVRDNATDSRADRNAARQTGLISMNKSGAGGGGRDAYINLQLSASRVVDACQVCKAIGHGEYVIRSVFVRLPRRINLATSTPRMIGCATACSVNDALNL